MTVQDFQLLFEFNSWANARARQAVESLPEEKLYVDMKEEYVGLGADLMVSKAGDLQLVAGRENLG